MGQTVKLRRSAVSGRVPNNSQLQLGELSMNTTDGKIFLAKSGSEGPSIEEVIITNTQNTGSLDIVGSISGSFLTGSFIGDGSGLYNIPASGVTGLSLDKISSGASTASIDANGLQVNVNTSITGSLTATEFTGSGLGLTNVPLSVSGSDANAVALDNQFTKFHFDDSTGIKISGDTSTGVAKIYLDGVAAETDGGTGVTSRLEVTSASSTWTFNHNLGEQYPAIIVFDSDDNVIIPQNIEAVSTTQLIVSFASPQTGYVTATVGGGLPSISSSYAGRVLAVSSNGLSAEWIDGVVSGSEQIDITGTTNYSVVTDRIDSIESFTSSIDETYATDEDVTNLRNDLNLYTSSTDDRLDSLETISGSHDGRLDSLETTTGSLDSRLDTIETTFSTSVNTRLTNVESSTEDNADNFMSYTSSTDDRLDSLETESGSIRTDFNSYTSSTDDRLDSIETTTGSQDGRLDSLETTSGSHNTRLGNLETFESKVDGGLEFTGSNVTIKGDLLVKGTETRVDSTTVEISDNIISLNGSGAASAGIEVRDTTSPGLLSGSLLWDSTNNYWVGGTKSNEERLLTNTDLTNLDGRLDSLETESGSIRSDFNSYTSSNDNNINGIDGRLGSLETTSGSHDGRLDSIESKTGSFLTSTNLSDLEGRVGSLETTSGSHDGRLDSLETESGSIRSDFNTVTSSFDGRLDSLEIESGSVRSALNTHTSSANGRLDSLESFTGSIDDTYATDQDVTNLRGDFNTYTSSNDTTNTTQNSRLTSLESATGSYTTTDYYTTGATFNTSNGVVTGTRNDGGTWTVDLDGRYLTSFTETDPIFSASPSANIADSDIENWNLAYGWGDHSQAGYLTSHPNVNAATSSNNSGRTYIQDILLDSNGHVTGLTTATETVVNTDEYTTGVTWNGTTAVLTFTRNDGDTYSVTMLETLSDVTVTGGTYNSGTQTLRLTKSDGSTVDVSGFAVDTDTNWYTTGATFNTVDGVLTIVGKGMSDVTVDLDGRYLTSYNDEYTTGATFNNTNGVVTFTRNDGDTFTVDLDGRYLTGYTETDPIFVASPAYNITTTNISNWNTAYGWGDHSQAGYLTSYNNEYTTGATFNTSNGIITFTRNDGDTFTVDIDGKYAESGHNHDSAYVNVGGDTMTGTLDVHVGDTGTILSSGNSSATGTPDQFFIKHVNGGVAIGNLRGDINFTNGNLKNDGNLVWDQGDFTTTQVSNWDTAYEWGDHSAQGYLTSYNNEYVTGASFNNTTAVLTFTRNDGDTFNVTLLDTLSDVTVTGGTYNSSNQTLTLTKSDGNTVDVSGFAIDTDVNWYTTGATFNTGNGIITGTHHGGTWTVDIDGRYLPLAGGTLTGDLTLSGVNPQINFNGTSDAGVDMAIKATPEGLDFYEPEDSNKIHFQILDDTGVNAAFGLQVGGTSVISSSRVLQNVSGNISMFTNDSGYLTSYNNEYVTGASFNTGNGIITFTRNDGDTFSVDIDGRFLTSYTETDTLATVTARGASTSTETSFNGQLNLNSTVRLDVNGTNFEIDTDVNDRVIFSFNKSGTRNWSLRSEGGNLNFYRDSGTGSLQISGNEIATQSWVTSQNYLTSYNNEYTTGATFNTSNGIITFTRNDGDTFTVDIDGRFLTSYTETDTLATVTTRGNTTSNSISVGDFQASHQSAQDATTKAEMLSMAVAKFKPHSTNSGTLAIAQVDSGNSVGLQFTNGAGTADWDMALQPFGGNVGINKINPSGALHVYSGTSERFLISGDVHVQGSTDLNINGTSRRFSFTSGTGTIRTTTANPLYLQTNSTTALTIDTNQNVSITGTLSASGYNKTNWDTAYSWGDHGSVGYITGYTETDTLQSVTDRGASIDNNITISKASAIINLGYQGGPHGINFYDDSSGNNDLRWGFYYRTSPDTITFETGGSSAKFTLDTSGNLTLTGTLSASGYNDSNWNTAYGWGDHSQAGYLTSYNNEYTTGATFNSTTGILTFTRNDGDTYTVNMISTLSDVTVTGGTYASGTQTLTLTKSDGNTVSVSGFAIDTDVNYYTTGATFSTSTGVITGTLNNGDTWTVDIDGRYLTSESDTLQSVTDRGATTDNALTITNDTRTKLYSTTNGVGVGLEFSDHSSRTQKGYIDYWHGDGSSYGSGNSFIVDGTEPTLSFVVKGKILYSEGIYTTPSTGTGGGTRKDQNWDTAYGWGDHSTQGYLTSYSETDTLATVTARGSSTTDDITTGNLTISHTGPTLILDDNNNAGGGGAHGKIIFKNTAGNAIGVGYTEDDTATSDFIISTDAGSTYGGYLGLASGAISDPSSIIIDPKTEVIITKNLDVTGTITASGKGTFDNLELTSGTQHLTFTESAEDWSILNAQQSNGLILYNGTGGVEIHYNGSSMADFDSTGITLRSSVSATSTLDVAGWATVGSLLVSNTAPYIDLVDTNSFTDANDRFRIRAAGNVGQIKWYDDSAGADSLLMTFNPDGTIGVEGNIDMGTNTITDTKVGQWDTAYGWGDHSQAGYLTGVTNISGYSGTLLREDNRTISPSELTSGRLKFGFTSWNNNNTSPYADFIHMRSYTDSSGGSDNLVMFKKDGIGMRLWQQTYGSATAYSSYADVWTSNDFTSTNVSNWNTAYGWGDHSTEGYWTSHADTSTLSGQYGGANNGVVIEDITVDSNGHVTAVGTRDLDGRFANLTSNNTLTGGNKITIQNQTDGTSARGIFMWDDTDTNWGIYMSTAGGAKSLADGTAASGLDGRTEHAIRFRVNDSASQIGFLWENASETALAQITADTGHLYTLGDVHAGGRVYVGSGGGNFYNDSGSRVRIDEDFYTNNNNTFLYGNNLYLGASSGDNVYVRGNPISGNNWDIATNGYATFTGGKSNGVWTVNSTSDAQILLQSSDSWTGIGFDDSASPGSDYIWHWGATGTFAIGGGGSSVSGKKLHIDGGTTIGSSLDAVAAPTDGLYVQSYLSVGAASNAIPLEVHGATSGSTVFDVQGTQGQLFSITDDLTGDLFTVSDISGIPILTVNASGTVTVDDTLHVTGDVIAYYSSDERLKDNVKPIENAIDKIRMIGGYEFDWNESSKNEGHDVGVIAQEVEKVLPEVVTTRYNGYKAVKYEKLTALLIQANKELIEKVEELEKKLNTK